MTQIGRLKQGKRPARKREVGKDAQETLQPSNLFDARF